MGLFDTFDPFCRDGKFEIRIIPMKSGKQIRMTKIQMTKTSHMDTRAVVLNFEYSDFDIVSDFGFRASDFHDAFFISCFINISTRRNWVKNF